MPKAYIIVDMDVTDPDRYATDYVPLSGPSVEAAGGRYLARGGETEVLEGDAQPHRTVIIEFESFDAAKAWYDSPAYLQARAAREGARLDPSSSSRACDAASAGRRVTPSRQ
jgi:uncharacterized protein (DUF1330 family)